MPPEYVRVLPECARMLPEFTQMLSECVRMLPEFNRMLPCYKSDFLLPFSTDLSEISRNNLFLAHTTRRISRCEC